MIVRAPAAGGFTLIELLMTLIIVGVLGAMGASLMGSGIRTYFVGRELAQDASEGTLAVERMTRDLRNAQSVTTMGAAALTFVDINGATVSYAVTGGSLTRAENGGPAQPLAANVSSLAFTYLKNDGQTAAATTTEVWYVSGTFTVASQNASIAFRGTVNPVNF